MSLSDILTAYGGISGVKFDVAGASVAQQLAGEVVMRDSDPAVAMVYGALGLTGAVIADGKEEKDAAALVNSIFASKEMTLEALRSADFQAIGRDMVAKKLTGGFIVHAFAESRVSVGQPWCNQLTAPKCVMMKIGGVTFKLDITAKASLAGSAGRMNSKIAMGIYAGIAACRFVLSERGAIVNDRGGRSEAGNVKIMVRGGLASDVFSMSVKDLEGGLLAHKEWRVKGNSQMTFIKVLSAVDVEESADVNPLIAVKGAYLRHNEKIAINTLKKVAIQALSRFLIGADHGPNSIGKESADFEDGVLATMRMRAIESVNYREPDFLLKFRRGEDLAKYAYEQAYEAVVGAGSSGGAAAPASKADAGK